VSNTIPGALTLRLPEFHKEEIETIAARMDMPQPPYFARLDACSTKGGKGGVGELSRRLNPVRFGNQSLGPHSGE
jgi:hypothetical protein